MNWHRTLELALFDLRWSIFRRKGLMYILPFGLFWYLVLKRFYDGAANWLQSSDFLMLAGTRFDLEIISRLFVELPPSLSAFFILAIYTTPLFTMLAANDLFATDLGSGYFRFLITRCHRIEIFLARCLGSLMMIASCTLVSGAAALLIATFIEAYPATLAAAYFVKISTILMLYSIPFIAGMAVLSAMLNSAIGVMLLAAAGYTMILIGIYIAEAAFDEPVMFFYLLPSGIKKDLISLEHADLFMAIACIPAYTLILAWIAWSIFKRRNF
jgi:hypothetical protein